MLALGYYKIDKRLPTMKLAKGNFITRVYTPIVHIIYSKS
jgi:hypothetical protein